MTALAKPCDMAQLEKLRLRAPAMYRYWVRRAISQHTPCREPCCIICQLREDFA
jgi:hypothetical protein